MTDRPRTVGPNPAELCCEAEGESARQLQAILASIAEGVNIVDAHGLVVLVNDGFMRLYGFPPELAAPGTPVEVFTRFKLQQQNPDIDLDAPEVRAQIAARRDEVLNSPPGQDDELLPDGRVVEIRRQRLAGGLLVSTYTDVTEHRRHAQRLRLLDAAVEQSADSVELADERYRLLYVNPAFTRLTGYTSREALGRSPASLLRSGLHDEPFYLDIEDTVERGEVWKGRMISRHKDGHLLYQDAVVSPVKDVHGRVAHTVAVKRDIADQVRAAEALRASEERFRSIVEDQTEFISRLGVDLTIHFVNQAYARQIGRPRDELIGTPVLDLMTEAQREVFLGQLKTLEPASPTITYEMSSSHPDGTSIWEEWTDRALFDGDGRLVEYLSVGRDITERRTMEQRLRASEQRFRTIADAHPVPMVIMRMADRVPLFTNAAFCELFGFDHRTINARELESLSVDLEERKRLFQLLKAYGRVDGYEREMRRVDGSVLPVSLNSRLIDYEGVEAAITGITDLTDKRRAELEIARQREALHQSEKISALGALLAGVAHELNNPLSVVVGQAVLLEELAPDDATRARAAKVRNAAERCARIIRTFLSMARSRPSERGPVHLNPLVEAALDLLAYGLRTAGVVVVRDFADDLPSIMGEADQLHQVLTNLIVNAQHALQERDPPRHLRIVTRREGMEVRLEVIDNGPGIAPHLADRVFEPFVTTKAKGVGTGIGLSVCRSIVAAHEGSIALESEPGRGATFIVRLPLEVSAADGAGLDSVLAEAGSAAGHILVVDDEPEIAALFGEVLRGAGHTVEIVTSGRDAIGRLDASEFDLVVSDVRMPDVDGPALHQELLRRGLAERIIFVTGDTLSHQVDRFLKESEVEVLEKPVAPEDLLEAVDIRFGRFQGSAK